MQLFLTDLYKKSDDMVVISDPRVVHQCRRVLRFRAGDDFVMQDGGVRYFCTLETMADGVMHARITKIETNHQKKESSPRVHVAVALLNKREKMEMIAQKVSEIGVSSLQFFPSHRSVIRNGQDKKYARMNLIVHEACEQSRGWTLPTLSFSDIFSPLGMVFYADFGGVSIAQSIALLSQKNPRVEDITILIGPEGGRDPRDAIFFENATMVSLGSSVLRAETAAIVASRAFCQS